MANAELKELFERVKQCFPEEKRALFREPTGEALWEHLSDELQNGYVRRWFEVTAGQQAEAFFFDEYRLLGAQEALTWRSRFEDRGLLRWVKPSWVPIASDDCGSWFVIDDRDGQVLQLYEEVEESEAVAESAQAWMLQLQDDKYTWQPNRGLVDKSSLGVRPGFGVGWLRMVPIMLKAATIGLILLGLVAVWFVMTRLSH